MENRQVLGRTPSVMLASAASARDIDLRAGEWGLPGVGLVEAAGRQAALRLEVRCAPILADRRSRIVALLGSGNNAADVLVLLKSFLFRGIVLPEQLELILVSNRIPAPESPCALSLKAFERSGLVPREWMALDSRRLLSCAAIVLDGLVGTGPSEPLSGEIAGCIAFLNGLRETPVHPLVVSMDLPSGLRDNWVPGEPVLEADITLAVEPVKKALYSGARVLSGEILPVTGIFPPALLATADGPRLISSFREVSSLMPQVRSDAWKHARGVLEIHAGELGTSGAPVLAARAAQAAGAGLVKLCVPQAILDIAANGAGGIMVEEDSSPDSAFSPSAILAGPGWRKKTDHRSRFEEIAGLESAGLPCVLDAGAIDLSCEHRFSGRAILTPHPGEFSRFTGLSREAGACDTDAILKDVAIKANAVIILKGHVIRVAAPDGRLFLFDGMIPALAAGGTGDVLAGLVSGLTARYGRAIGTAPFDAVLPAVAAVALFLESGRALSHSAGFFDPLSLIPEISRLAGEAWLPGGRGA